MLSFILVIHLIIAIVLIVLVLLQRSEGGGLGIGGSGDFMSGRAVGNVLSRMTAIFATIFLLQVYLWRYYQAQVKIHQSLMI